MSYTNKIGHKHFENQDFIADSGLFMPNVSFSDLAFHYGKGCYLYDYNADQYLDFNAGIAVASLGHAHPLLRDALSEQACKLMTLSAAYLSEPKVECARLLVEKSCMDQVFFCNSGTESIEAAVKLVRKWAYDTKGTEAKDIIVFSNSFHGRTAGAASLTAKRATQPETAPYLSGVKEAVFNDISSVEALIDEKTAAVFIEPLQGGAGVYPADRSFLQALRQVCTDHNIALVFDEIQCGFGRIGTFFAYEMFGVEPDVVCLAKGLGGGVPVGAVLGRKKFTSHFTVDIHGSTFGGNPLTMHVTRQVIEFLNREEFLVNVNKQGDYLLTGLERLRQEVPCITDLRGTGLLIGIEVNCDIAQAVTRLQENKLLVSRAGRNTIRLTPPLIIEQEHCDHAIDILERTLLQF